MRRIIAGLNRLEELTLTLTLLGMALIAFVQVVCRYALGISFTWFEEGGRYLGIFITLLGSGIGIKRGAHFSMDLLATSVRPAFAKALQLFAGVASGGVMVLVAWFGTKVVLRNYGYETTSPTMQLPMYLVYLPVPVFAALMAIRCFLAAGKAVRGVAPAGGGEHL